MPPILTADPALPKFAYCLRNGDGSHGKVDCVDRGTVMAEPRPGWRVRRGDYNRTGTLV